MPADSPVEDGLTPARDDEPEGDLSRKVVRAGTAATAFALFTQVLSLASFVVLAHYAPPSTFGEYAAASVLLGLSGLFTEGGMHAAVIQRQDRVAEAASTAFLANLVGGLVLGVLGVAAAPIIAFFFHSRTIGIAAASLAGTIPLNAAAIVPGAMIRRRVSARLALVQPLTVIGYGGAAVPLLIAGMGVWGLVIATYVSAALRTTVIWIFSGWRPQFRLVSWEMWRSLARYGRPVMIGMFLREVGFAGITAFVGRAFDTTVLGQFRYAQRLVTQATTSVTLSGAYVLLPAFTRIFQDAKRFEAAVLRALRILTLLVFPISLAFIPLGRPLASTILGKQWSGAGPIMMALAGTGLALSFVSVCGEAFKACGRTDLLPRLHTITATAPLLLMFALLPAGPVGMGIAVSVGWSVEALYGARAMAGILGIPLVRMLRQVEPALLASLVMVATLFALDGRAVHAAHAHGASGVARVALEMGAGALAYFLALLLLSRRSLFELQAAAGYLFKRPSWSRRLPRAASTGEG